MCALPRIHLITLLLYFPQVVVDAQLFAHAVSSLAAIHRHAALKAHDVERASAAMQAMLKEDLAGAKVTNDLTAEQVQRIGSSIWVISASVQAMPEPEDVNVEAVIRQVRPTLAAFDNLFPEMTQISLETLSEWAIQHHSTLVSLTLLAHAPTHPDPHM